MPVFAVQNHPTPSHSEQLWGLLTFFVEGNVSGNQTCMK